MDGPSQRQLVVKCPRCQKCFAYYSSDFRPFCCERCRLIDLGRWLSDGYVVAGPQASKEKDGSGGEEEVAKEGDEGGEGDYGVDEEDGDGVEKWEY